VKKWGCWQF